MLNDADKLISEIAMWGPPRSGKTWLLHAFGKQLSEISEQDSNFDYILTNEEGIPIMISSPPDPVPTMDYEDHVWTFQRRAKISSAAHRISSHSHRIIAHDGRGANLVELDEMAQLTLLNSDCLLLLLDPVGDSPAKSNTTEANRPPSRSKRKYYSLVVDLLNLLESNPRRLKYLAICVTKIDALVTEDHDDPWPFIQSHFGRQLHDKLLHQSLQLELAAFCLSSVGYIKDPTQNQAPRPLATIQCDSAIFLVF
jgi:hypothetical protein